MMSSRSTTWIRQTIFVLYRVNDQHAAQVTLSLALIYQTGFGQHPITAKFPAAVYYLQLVNARSVHIADRPSRSPKAQALLTHRSRGWGWVDTGQADAGGPDDGQDADL